MNLRTNPELLPLIEWWEKDGKETVIYLLVAAIAVGGWYGWKHHKAAVKEAASNALVNAYTTEEIEDLLAKAPEGFADVPVVGKAQCLEALGKFDEAAKAFDAFAEANPTNYLTLTAQLGAVRCYAQQGDKKKALARLDALKVANKDDEMAEARVEAIEALVKRYGKKASPAPVAKPVEVKSAEVKPAVTNEVKKIEKATE